MFQPVHLEFKQLPLYVIKMLDYLEEYEDMDSEERA
jgi:hypothetical protein